MSGSHIIMSKEVKSKLINQLCIHGGNLTLSIQAERHLACITASPSVYALLEKYWMICSSISLHGYS